MPEKIALIISILLITICAYAQEQIVEPETPAGYEWSSPLGSLRQSQRNPNVYIFDTTAGNTLTVNKQRIVPYNTEKDKDLTDLGKTLKGKLLKIEGVADVAVEYRRLWVQKFPLDNWDLVLPEMKKVLK